MRHELCYLLRAKQQRYKGQLRVTTGRMVFWVCLGLRLPETEIMHSCLTSSFLSLLSVYSSSSSSSWVRLSATISNYIHIIIDVFMRSQEPSYSDKWSLIQIFYSKWYCLRHDWILAGGSHKRKIIYNITSKPYYMSYFQITLYIYIHIYIICHLSKLNKVKSFSTPRSPVSSVNPWAAGCRTHSTCP